MTRLGRLPGDSPLYGTNRAFPLLRNSIYRASIMAGACFAAVVPFFWLGNPSGHDFEFHVFSWMEVLGQWTLGGALGAVLPWKIVPGAYCWIVLALAGAAMYRLAREWLSPQDALFAAVFYALNPYHLLVVYWRSAYAELLGAALLPLLVLCLVRIFSRESESGLRPTLGLSLVLAGGGRGEVAA